MQTRQFAGYELLGRIASGGMAEVYLARRHATHRVDQLVALKLLLPNLAEDPDFVAMFGDEARILGRLAHPNIVGLHEFSREHGHLYMALEYVHGEALAALVARSKDRGGLSPQAIVYIGGVLARALHAAHEACDVEGHPMNVLHRDVSPHNVLIGYDGVTKLIDFGVASATGRDTRSSVGTLKGKFCYMAPEQFSDGPVDRRADLWALGVVLWEMATMRRLFLHETEAATVRHVLEGTAPELWEVTTGVPVELSTLVSSMLQRDPAERPATALEIARALDHIGRRLPRFDEVDLGAVMSDLFAVERVRKEEMVKVALAPNIEEFLFRQRSDTASAYDSLASSSPVTGVERPGRKRLRRRWRAIGRLPLIAGAALVVGLLALPLWLGRADAELPFPDAGVPFRSQAAAPPAMVVPVPIALPRDPPVIAQPPSVIVIQQPAPRPKRTRARKKDPSLEKETWSFDSLVPVSAERGRRAPR